MERCAPGAWKVLAVDTLICELMDVVSGDSEGALSCPCLATVVEVGGYRTFSERQ